MKETPDKNSILDEISARGLRLTSQRKAIVETIQQSRQHLDAETLLQLARKRNPGINRATVYRTLGLLKRMRLIDELDLMHLEGEKHFYETRTHSGHFHLACLGCRKIVEHETPTFKLLRQEIAEQTGFSIDVIRLEVGGRCPECRRGQSDLSNGAAPSTRKKS